jgi:hypothetical protein
MANRETRLMREGLSIEEVDRRVAEPIREAREERLDRLQRAAAGAGSPADRRTGAGSKRRSGTRRATG